MCRASVALCGEGMLFADRALRRQPTPAGRERCVEDVRASMRGSGGEWDLWDADTGERLERMDGKSAWLRLYEGAVQLIDGRAWLTIEVDPFLRRAFAEPVMGDFAAYTSPIVESEITIVRERARADGDGGALWGFGDIEIRLTRTGFYKRSQRDGSVLSSETLPESERALRTTALWCGAPEAPGRDPAPALHAVEHAGMNALAMLAMTDPRDIGGAVDAAERLVYFYDAVEGGAGVAERGFVSRADFAARIEEIISGCGCAAGCPRCVQSDRCSARGGDEPSKPAGMLLARQLVRTVAAMSEDPLAFRLG